MLQEKYIIHQPTIQKPTDHETTSAQDPVFCRTEERWEVFKTAVCQLRQLVSV